MGDPASYPGAWPCVSFPFRVGDFHDDLAVRRHAIHDPPVDDRLPHRLVAPAFETQRFPMSPISPQTHGRARCTLFLIHWKLSPNRLKTRRIKMSNSLASGLGLK